MPRIFLPPEIVTGEKVTLGGDQHRYLAKVLRLRPGDEITVFDGAGTEIAARIERIDARTTLVGLGARRTVLVAARPLVLLQAIARGERMDLIVQKTTELGVSRIVPVVSERTVARPGPGGRWDRWRTIASEAARQCGRADVPVIDEPRTLAGALRADLPDARLLLWEEAREAEPLRRALRGDEPAVALLVGAEGGFSGAEAEAAAAAGFRAVGLGARILRTETAAIVAVALAQAALGGLD